MNFNWDSGLSGRFNVLSVQLLFTACDTKTVGINAGLGEREVHGNDQKRRKAPQPCGNNALYITGRGQKNQETAK
jgi:hypothetical protein